MRTKISIRGALFLIVEVIFIQGAWAESPTCLLAAGATAHKRLSTIQKDVEKALNIKVELLSRDGMAGESVLMAVNQGKADLGLAGPDCNSFFESANAKGIKPTSQVICNEVARSELFFVTYKDGPKELTQEQIVKLMTGKVSNWKEVGGSDLPVIIVIRENMHAIQAFIKKKLFDGVDFKRAQSKFFTEESAHADFIGNTPGAIGFGTATFPKNRANVPRQPEIGIPLVMLTNGEPRKDCAKILELFAPNGKLPEK